MKNRETRRLTDEFLHREKRNNRQTSNQTIYDYMQGFFLAVHARMAFQNLFEGTNFQKRTEEFGDMSKVWKLL
jgi:hypothetical protein